VATEAELVQYARERYGFLAFFLDIPEIRTLLVTAQKKGWGADEIKGALYKTTFWKTTSDTQRQWDLLKKQDPATAKQQSTQMQTNVSMLAKSLGVALTPARLKALTESALRNGTDENALRQMVLAEFDYNAEKAQTGEVGSVMAKLKQIAAEYLIPQSGDTLEKWTRDIVAGYQDEETFRQMMVAKATGKYPGLTDFLARGGTVVQYADDYYESAAELLGIPRSAINPAEAKWKKPLQATTADGKPAVMTATEWEKELMTNVTYGYADSKHARERASELTASLSEMFTGV
jgi:hypothetical protein